MLTFKLVDDKNSVEELFALYNFIKPITFSDIQKKLEISLKANDLLSKKIKLDFDWFLIYKAYLDEKLIGIGAVKYCVNGTAVREKRKNGLYLIKIPSYFEVGDISILPQYRQKGYSREIFGFLMMKIYELCNSIYSFDEDLLICGVGYLNSKLSEFNKDKFIPRNMFSIEEWSALGRVRPQTIATKTLSEDMSLQFIGVSKTHGGPIFWGSILDTCQSKFWK